MAKINIDNLEVNGSFTVQRKKVVEENKTYLVSTGVLCTHLYFDLDSVNSIENHRYKLTNIREISETFGSDDFNIIYEFLCDIEIKGYVIDELPNVIFDNSISEITEIEDKLYSDEDERYGSFFKRKDDK